MTLVIPELRVDATSEATQLRESMMALARRLRRHRSVSDLTPSQLQMLGDIQRSGVIVPGELAARQSVRVQSLTGGLNTLEDRGLIARRTDPDDRRRQLIELTPAAEDLLRRDRAERDAWLEQALHTNLTELERGVLALAAPILAKLAYSDT